jgi:transporter family protein
MKERLGMAPWILPTLGYIVILGVSGVTAKLALRTLTWQELVLWVPLAYALFAIPFVVVRGDRLSLGAGGGWAIATALCVSSALVLFFVALTHGDASKVVPASAAYPAVTLLGSALFLSEAFTATRAVGTLLVIAGVVLVSR